MAALQRRWAAELVHFWFHSLKPGDWYRSSAEVDEALRRRFGRHLAALHTQPAESFLADPRTALAAVLLFDQVPRNRFRGSAQAFATDPLARKIAKAALDRGWDRALSVPERQFLAMPLQHSEAIADQRRGVAYFTRLGIPAGLTHARDHWKMIARFGRFPHRNNVLGRTSTPAEKRAVAAGFAW